MAPPIRASSRPMRSDRASVLTWRSLYRRPGGGGNARRRRLVSTTDEPPAPQQQELNLPLRRPPLEFLLHRSLRPDSGAVPCPVSVRDRSADTMASQQPSVTWSGADVMSVRIRALRSASSVAMNKASESKARCAERQVGLPSSAVVAARVAANSAGMTIDRHDEGPFREGLQNSPIPDVRRVFACSVTGRPCVKASLGPDTSDRGPPATS